jgi:2-polyprenyl-6-methoxyphenol hydroxylase-like FAD-dependent oxidoreductase
MSECADRPLVADVCVVGGGPAGATTAAGLAKHGYRVVLIDRAAPPSRLECLSRDARMLLDTGGICDRQTLELLPCPGIRVRWSNPQPEERVHEATVLIRRGGLDRMLVVAARRSGAIVLSPARAGVSARSGSGWKLVAVSDAGCRQIVARFVVDAGGRRSGFAGRRRRLSPLTVALSAPCVDLACARAEMRVEATERGWCWGAFAPGGAAEVSAFLDTRVCAGLDAAGRRTTYRTALAACGLFAAVRPTSAKVAVCDASSYVDEDPVSENSIKVGDAALAQDPLSSQGVQAALRSGFQATAVVHTMLSGGDAAAAIAFYRGAIAGAASHHQLIAQEYYSACDRWPEAVFWRARRTTVPAPESPPVLTGDLRLVLSPDARLVPVPTLAEAVISYRLALLHPQLPRPVAFVGGVVLADLLLHLSAGRSASQILADWRPRLPRERGIVVLNWLVRIGVLVPTSGRKW